MASHSEIKVGSSEWVVRVAGEDVRVKVMAKEKKPSGRGYEFRLRRVGNDNRVFGRNITRGSGALRKPGDPVKAFGGAAPFKKKTKKAARKAPAKRASSQPPQNRSAARPPPPPPAKINRTKRKTSTPRTTSTASSYTPPQLSSLRGRGRPTRSAPARPPARKEGFQVSPKSEKVKKVIRALERLPSGADDYMIRNTVAEILAQVSVLSYRR